MEITEDKIKYATGEYDVEVVRRLALPSAGLTRICGLDRCARLVQLSLPRNRISRIEGLESLLSLQRLDLSNNEIRVVTGLAHLVSLEFLDLQGNDISDAKDVRHLTGLPVLAHLHFQSFDKSNKNPCCDHSDYARTVADLLPKLAVLDGERQLLRAEGQDFEQLLEDLSKPDAEATRELPARDWADGTQGFWKGGKGVGAEGKAALAGLAQAEEFTQTAAFELQTNIADLIADMDLEMARCRSKLEVLEAAS
ncbi:hypothetical protein M885DRAFT_514398 [Pelagophyceae sp. CCMP2097]|nr:hypothetical protein M885DRAFT_514398 [Pelagophyceae sp. CCMP2097]